MNILFDNKAVGTNSLEGLTADLVSELDD